ncbi:MAG: hypothetical protein LBH40_02675 [Alphaproteobacteria bacterium]|jgi:lipopolysaccharide biosynthesis glycosyltransferase|nr:hypothetical protein [Alphaproteobacteria bacterium]
MDKQYNISFSINRNHQLFAMTTLYSLLKNNPKCYFNIYILHNNCLNQNEIDDICNQFPLNQFNNFKINLIDTINIDVIQNKTAIYSSNKKLVWEKEILFKLFLHQLLPNVDKVLHLDSDVLIRGDISKIFNIEDNYLFKAGNVEPNKINAGILLFNLKLARELKIEEKIIAYLQEHNATEEEVVNNLFLDKVSWYDTGLVLHFRKGKFDKNVVALHYILSKPFHLNQSITSIALFLEYYKYLIDFIEPQSKVKFFLLITLFSFLSIFFSYRRRLQNWRRKHFNKKIYDNNHSFYVRDKIIQYSIIKQP